MNNNTHIIQSLRIPRYKILNEISENKHYNK